MRLLVLVPSSKMVRAQLGVESREVRLRVDGIESPEVGMPRTVEVEDQRADGSELIGEVTRVFPIWGASVVSSAFDIKK